jgi:integrase
MSDVTLRRLLKKMHIAACQRSTACTCPVEDKGWQYDIRFTWPSGNEFRERRMLDHPDFTKKKALDWATERRNQILADGEAALTKAMKEELTVPTVEEFKPDYVRHKKNQRLKASTEYAREIAFRKWIIPVLGKMRLDEIDLAAIDLLKEAMEEKSEKYVNNVLAILSNMVRTARAMRRIRELPVESFGLFKVDNSKPPPFYMEEEYGRLIEAALKIDLRLAVVVLLGGDAGLRSGEIRALAPYDVKWGENHLHIEKQVWRDVVDSPKSGRGRIIPMTDRLAFAIRKLGRVKGDSLLVDDGGGRFSTKRMRSLMKRAQREAGLEATGNVHLLRHSFCTHLAMAGKPPTVIQELAGHRHLTTTMRYMHVVKGAKEEAIKALNRPLPTGLAPREEPATPRLGRILEAKSGK